MTSPLTFEREALGRAVERLAPFDLHVLLRLAGLADAVTGTLTAPWDGLVEVVGLPRAVLQSVVERLHRGGFLPGRVDAPDGLHVHLGDLLQLPPRLPSNLPLEPPDV